MALLGPADGIAERGCWGLLVWAEREPWEMVDRELGPRPQIKITTVIRIAMTYKVLTICPMLG